MAKNSNREEKKPLWRKVNTKARGVSHRIGGNYRDARGQDWAIGMNGGVRRGLDFNPLFRFLLSKVGRDWEPVYQEARARLPDEEPIFWMVSRTKDPAAEVVRIGDCSYYSGLYVDGSGVLRAVNPDLDEGTLEPSCRCCTHTLNGVPFTRKFGA